MEENKFIFIISISINAIVMYKYDIMLYWSTLPDKKFSAQTSIASAKFLVLEQSLNLSQQFPFDFCSFPAGQGEPLPQGEPSLGSLVGTQLCPIWLLLGIMGLCAQWEGQKNPAEDLPCSSKGLHFPSALKGAGSRHNTGLQKQKQILHYSLVSGRLSPISSERVLGFS